MIIFQNYQFFKFRNEIYIDKYFFMKYNNSRKWEGSDNVKENKIREYREKAKLTQQELGAMIGKSQIAISLYESGERTPSIKVSKAIAKALNTTLDSIFMP